MDGEAVAGIPATTRKNRRIRPTGKIDPFIKILFWRKVNLPDTKGLWRQVSGSGRFFEFRYDFRPGQHNTPDPHLPPLLDKGPY